MKFRFVNAALMKTELLICTMQNFGESQLKKVTSPTSSFFVMIPPATKLQGDILVSPCPSVRLQTNPMSYDNLSYVSQNLLKFYQLFIGEERRIPLFFDDFHFCPSRVIGLDMTENRIFTLCRMITWIVFSQNVLKFYQQLTGEERRRVPFIFGQNNQ